MSTSASDGHEVIQRVARVLYELIPEELARNLSRVELERDALADWVVLMMEAPTELVPSIFPAPLNDALAAAGARRRQFQKDTAP